MKTNLTLSLDSDIAIKLKRESNYSDLVNEQIKLYYDANQINNQQILRENLQKIKQNIRESNKKRREIEAKIAKIKQKEEYILEKVKSRPALIKRITEKRAAINSHNSYQSVIYSITPEEEADRILKGGSQIT